MAVINPKSMTAWAMAALLPVSVLHAQEYPGGNGTSVHDVVDAVILNELSQQQKERRDTERQVYVGPSGMGSISTAAQASKACVSEALADAGPDVTVSGSPVTHTMSTGWEVEGGLSGGGEGGPHSFVCSVRNGSVTGVLLRR